MDGEIFALHISFKCVCCKTFHLFRIPCWMYARWEIEIANPNEWSCACWRHGKTLTTNEQSDVHESYRHIPKYQSREIWMSLCMLFVKFRDQMNKKIVEAQPKNILQERLVFWNYKLCIIYTKWWEKIGCFVILFSVFFQPSEMCIQCFETATVHISLCIFFGALVFFLRHFISGCLAGMNKKTLFNSLVAWWAELCFCRRCHHE